VWLKFLKTYTYEKISFFLFPFSFFLFIIFSHQCLMAQQTQPDEHFHNIVAGNGPNFYAITDNFVYKIKANQTIEKADLNSFFTENVFFNKTGELMQFNGELYIAGTIAEKESDGSDINRLKVIKLDSNLN